MRRERFWRDFGRNPRDVCRALAESVFYRKAIFDPPEWPRFRLFLPVRKTRR